MMVDLENFMKKSLSNRFTQQELLPCTRLGIAATELYTLGQEAILKFPSSKTATKSLSYAVGDSSATNSCQSVTNLSPLQFPTCEENPRPLTSSPLRNELPTETDVSILLPARKRRETQHLERPSKQLKVSVLPVSNQTTNWVMATSDKECTTLIRSTRTSSSVASSIPKKRKRHKRNPILSGNRSVEIAILPKH